MNAPALPVPSTPEKLAILALYKLDAWTRATRKGGA